MKRWYVGDVMTRDVVSVGTTTGYKEIADLMVHHSISAVPVVDADPQIRASVTERVLRSLWIDPALVDVAVRAGIVTLTGQLDRRSTADIVVAFTKATPGVVDVVDKLDYDTDDRDTVGFGWYRANPAQPTIR